MNTSKNILGWQNPKAVVRMAQAVHASWYRKSGAPAYCEKSVTEISWRQQIGYTPDGLPKFDCSETYEIPETSGNFVSIEGVGSESRVTSISCCLEISDQSCAGLAEQVFSTAIHSMCMLYQNDMGRVYDRILIAVRDEKPCAITHGGGLYVVDIIVDGETRKTTIKFESHPTLLCPFGVGEVVANQDYCVTLTDEHLEDIISKLEWVKNHARQGARLRFETSSGKLWLELP